MFLHLTDTELLDYRLRMAGLEPADLQFTIERTDGIDIDAIVANRLRRWYVDLLHNAPLELLPVENVASSATVSNGIYPGSATIILASDCLRPQRIRMDGWETEAAVLPAQEMPRLAAMQGNRFASATSRYPVAVEIPGRPGEVCVWPIGSAIAALIAVKDPGDSLYIIEESLLNTLPIDNIFQNL